MATLEPPWLTLCLPGHMLGSKEIPNCIEKKLVEEGDTKEEGDRIDAIDMSISRHGPMEEFIGEVALLGLTQPMNPSIAKE